MLTEGEKVGTLSASCMGTFSGLILTVPKAIQRRKHLNFVLIMWLQRIICFNSFFKAFVCVFVELIDHQGLSSLLSFITYDFTMYDDSVLHRERSLSL